MDSAAFTSEPPTGPERVRLTQPSPYSDALTREERKALEAQNNADPGIGMFGGPPAASVAPEMPFDRAADVWIGCSIEQLQQLVVDFVALRNSSILAADQMPTLAAFAERCRLEYRARTGRELVVQVKKEARR